MSDPVVELSGNCQIMSKVAEITGTLETVDKYGRDSEMAYQLELRYGELANDEEKAIIAYHEGGHAMVQRILPKCDPVVKVSIISRIVSQVDINASTLGCVSESWITCIIVSW